MKQFRTVFELPYLCLFLTVALTVGAHAISWTGPAKEKLAAAAYDENLPMETSARLTLAVSCTGCHQNGRSGMDLDTDALDLETMKRNRYDWERVVQKLRNHEMPPESSPQLSAREREVLITWVEQRILQTTEPGADRPMMARRLQRTEYVNTLRDLLGVSFQPEADFPKDDTHWSVSADTPEISPPHLARYRSAAQDLLDQAMAAELDQAENYGADDDEPDLGSDHRLGSKMILFSFDHCEKSRQETGHDIIAAFARRAYRQPVDAAEIERLTAIFDDAEKDGKSFAEAMKTALVEVLISPTFLCRLESREAGKDALAKETHREQFALATRLSYFLWRSTPDDELLSLAERGELTKNLDAQVRRMLQDPQAQAFAVDFAGSWLPLEKLQFMPNLDEPLQIAMRRETEMLVETIMREDRSVLEFLDADYTFVNERLADHYKLSGVRGAQMRRVKVDAKTRGGLLGHGSILCAEYGSDTTSPVRRGKWVLETLLGAAPVRPPAGLLQALKSGPSSSGAGTVLTQIELHRANPACAKCHVKMDSIGLTLENFDGRGAWRDNYNLAPVDATGVLPDGETLKGPGELKAYLMKNRDQFVRTLGSKLLHFALGRKLDDRDRASLEQIPVSVAKNQHRFSEVILEVVRSESFRNGSAESLPQGQATK